MVLYFLKMVFWIKRFTPGLFLLVLCLFIFGCKTTPDEAPLQDYEVAGKWAELTLFITKNTPANSPTYASRCLGYIGLTMYESIVAGYPAYNSLAGQLNGLDKLPGIESGKSYNWPIALNAGQAVILKNLYNQTADSCKAKIDSLEDSIFKNLSSSVEDKAVSERSVAYGRSVAQAIFEWSKTDGGHRAYLKNFDKTFKHPEFPGSWQPPLFAQSFSHHPLHPYWGKNRTFLKENAELETPYMIPYDTAAQSTYYQQFIAVYEKEKTLTQEEKEIAIWWGDDPDVTFTPPGHSYYLATMVINEKKPNLIQCAETYAHVGMAVADAFINCWKWKYHYFSERPNTFIPKFIDEKWESFWPDPPFPAFPSGHAIQAAAAVTVLIDLYGNEFRFTDRSHVGRERDEVRDVDFKERSFTTLSAVAEETANSRFYGGIHVPQDNRVGLEQGAIIAGNINQLKWKKEK
jgi:hypothetical protein